MLYIRKKTEPRELTQAKRNGLQDYDTMPTDLKDIIRQQLLTEQGYLCAYCMRRINLDTVQIEHYIAQHPTDGDYDPALTIDYSNMLGVCPGNKCQGLPAKYLTCDQHRKNIPLTVDPRKAESIAAIQYRADGVIFSNIPSINEDIQTTLNLNCAAVHLPENRKAALDALKKKIFLDCKDKAATKSYFQRLYSSLCNKDTLSEYLGILLASIFRQKQITSEKFGKSGFSKSRFSQKITVSKK